MADNVILRLRAPEGAGDIVNIGRYVFAIARGLVSNDVGVGITENGNRQYLIGLCSPRKILELSLSNLDDTLTIAGYNIM